MSQVDIFQNYLQPAQLTDNQTVLMMVWFKKLSAPMQSEVVDLLINDSSAIVDLAVFLERKRNALQSHNRAEWNKVVDDESVWLSRLA